MPQLLGRQRPAAAAAAHLLPWPPQNWRACGEGRTGRQTLAAAAYGLWFRVGFGPLMKFAAVQRPSLQHCRGPQLGAACGRLPLPTLLPGGCAGGHSHPATPMRFCARHAADPESSSSLQPPPIQLLVA